jgi:hypothetical protein
VISGMPRSRKTSVRDAVVEQSSRVLPDGAREHIGHPRNALGSETKIITLERVVEHIRCFERWIAKDTFRVDHQPIARPVKDIVVMYVTVQRTWQPARS